MFKIKGMNKGKSENTNKNTEEIRGNQIGLEVKLPGCDEFVPLGKAQYNRVYLDDLGGRLLVVVDEVAELLEPSGLKTMEAKEEDALKQEIVGSLKSITQLGRSSGIHCILCTQRNDASIIPGVIQNNPLSLDTRLHIKRKVAI